MPLTFAPMVGLLGIAIAMIRRSSKTSPDARLDDMPTRLLRWAIDLLSPQRAPWGQAMLGELDHIDGQARRWQFALGCVVAALVMPPWGRAASGALALIAIAVGGIGIHAGMSVHYQLGVVDWVAVVVQGAVLTALILCCSVLLRRPAVVLPGLVGGLVVALTALSLSGFSFLDQINPDTVPWHPWVITVAVPFVVGVAGTLWSADPAVGKRIARLAAISGSLGLYLYGNIAVAAIGGGGPFDQDGGGTLRGTISDRLANNLVLMLVIVTVAATIGWGGAAATGALKSLRVRPAADTNSASVTITAKPPASATRSRVWAPRARSALLIAVVISALTVGAVGWISG